MRTREYDGNTFTIIRSLLPGWCLRNKRRREEDNYYRRGVRDFHHSIDIVHLIRLRKRLKILERAVLNPGQIQLSKMSKYNFLRNNVSSSSDDAEYAIKQERTLDGYQLSSAIDAALLRQMEMVDGEKFRVQTAQPTPEDKLFMSLMKKKKPAPRLANIKKKKTKKEVVNPNSVKIELQ